MSKKECVLCQKNATKHFICSVHPEPIRFYSLGFCDECAKHHQSNPADFYFTTDGKAARGNK